MFFCAKEKSPKERRPHCLRPSANALGNLRCFALGGVWLNSLRSNNASPDPLSPALLVDATRRGHGSGHPARQSRACALGACGALRHRSRFAGSPSVCAEERSFKWIRARDCLSRRRIRAGPHLKRAPQVPVAPAKGADSGGGLSFGYFSLATQRKVTAPPGAHPGRRCT